MIGAAVVVIAAGLYAVTGGGGSRDEIAGGRTANSITSTPAPSLLSVAGGGASIAGVLGAKIVFATPVHDVGQIKGGEVVKYTYVFTNAGDRLLEVSGVQTSCGCTTAGDWTRQVEPGKTGNIPIQFNSGSFSGQVAKSITVTCNDTNQPKVVLQIKATIWKPIDVTPQFAMLHVTAESQANETTVRIVSNEETPLTLSAPESSNPAFATELRTNQPGKEYQLVVKTVPPLPAGSVQGQITLKTSSTNVPLISVTAFANVQETVTVMPNQITLPAVPLTNTIPAIVSIRNNGTNTLALSEPAVNERNVDVQLKEIEPGHSFTLTVSFPEGFEIAQGQKVEVSVKSNHPRFPMIKVPVIQSSLRVPPAVSAGRPEAFRFPVLQGLPKTN